MDYERLERILREMQARGEPVRTLVRKTRNWIVRVEAWGVELRSEEARVNATREFTWEEIEEGSNTHGAIKRALRHLVDQE